jgi:hypothetical protein
MCTLYLFAMSSSDEDPLFEHIGTKHTYVIRPKYLLPYSKALGPDLFVLQHCFSSTHVTCVDEYRNPIHLDIPNMNLMPWKRALSRDIEPYDPPRR